MGVVGGLWDRVGNHHLGEGLRALPCSPEGGTLTRSLVVLAVLGNTLLVQGVGAEHTLGKGTGFELWGTVYKVAEEDTGLDRTVVFLW